MVGVLFLQVDCYNSVAEARGDVNALICGWFIFDPLNVCPVCADCSCQVIFHVSPGTGGFLAGAVFAMIFLAIYLLIAATLATTYYARLPTAAVCFHSR